MELIFSGKLFSGVEVEKWGIVVRMFLIYEVFMEEIMKFVEIIVSYFCVVIMGCKEVVNKSQDLLLCDGVEYERCVFYGIFGSQDQKIGMKVFVEKKKVEWIYL